MTENKECLKCKYNNYPICSGIIMFDGNSMNIENLKEGFRCEQKERDIIVNFSEKIKTDLEIKIEELENRIKELETSKP